MIFGPVRPPQVRSIPFTGEPALITDHHFALHRGRIWRRHLSKGRSIPEINEATTIIKTINHGMTICIQIMEESSLVQSSNLGSLEFKLIAWFQGLVGVGCNPLIQSTVAVVLDEVSKE